MANSILGNQAQSNMNSANMMQQFQQFAQTVTPAGAKAKVEELLRSGQMTQEQFRNFSQMANQMRGFLR